MDNVNFHRSEHDNLELGQRDEDIHTAGQRGFVVRAFTKHDIPALVYHLREGLKDYHYGDKLFDQRKIENLLLGNVNNPSFFCAVLEVDGEIAGAMSASVMEYMFSHEAYAQDHITYIRPEYRKLGLKAITSLVRAYQQWARERCVREIRWSQSSGFKMQKFSSLAKRLGFTQIGSLYRMEIGK